MNILPRTVKVQEVLHSVCPGYIALERKNNKDSDAMQNLGI